MAEVGTYYITIMPSMDKFTGAVNSAMQGAGTTAGNKFTGSFGDVLKGSALGTIIGNLGTELANTLMAGFNTGIRRLDVLENFPRVMEALGFEAGEASSSIQLIMDRLDGLPTATQDVVTLTQAIADSTNDLNLATRAALGFNDMMLANGASSGEMTQAMGVFNRVLGKGNATTAQWMSLQSVMPAQLAMVAREVLGEGASVEGLRDALNEGEVAWEDFLWAIVKLDEEGGGRYASFRDQAVANSVGIGTALTNVQNRVGAGWAEILGAVGQKNISGAIDNFSYGIRNAMFAVGDAVQWLKYTILGTGIDEALVKLGQIASEFFSGLVSESDVTMLKDLARAFLDLVDGALTWLADHGEVVKVALGGIVGAVAALMGWNIGLKIAALIPAVEALMAAISANPVVLIVAAVSAAAMALYTFFTQTETGRQVWERLKETFVSVYEKLKSVTKGMVTAIQDFVKKAKAKWEEITKTATLVWTKLKASLEAIINAIKSHFSGKLEEMKSTASNIFNVIRTVITTIVEGIRSTVANRFEGIKNAITVAITTAKAVVDGFLSALKTIWDATFGAISTTTDGTMTTITNLFKAMTSGVSGIVSGMTSSLSSAWRGISDGATSVFGSMKDSVTNAFSKMSSNASASMDRLNSEASTKASKIASHFKNLNPKVNVGVSYPYLASIYSKVEKSSLLGGGKVSQLYWAAQGAVFDMPTIIGIGEAGKEAALPLNEKTYREMARGIVNEMGDGSPGVTITGNTFIVRNDRDIDAIADAVALRIERQRRGKL